LQFIARRRLPARQSARAAAAAVAGNNYSPGTPARLGACYDAASPAAGRRSHDPAFTLVGQVGDPASEVIGVGG
jgi:hypothetical protein